MWTRRIKVAPKLKPSTRVSNIEEITPTENVEPTADDCIPTQVLNSSTTLSSKPTQEDFSNDTVEVTTAKQPEASSPLAALPMAKRCKAKPNINPSRTLKVLPRDEPIGLRTDAVNQQEEFTQLQPNLNKSVAANSQLKTVCGEEIKTFSSENLVQTTKKNNKSAELPISVADNSTTDSKSKIFEGSKNDNAVHAEDDHNIVQPVSCSLKSRITKIRPVIKNGPHRVRTFSSASESEDEGRRQARSHLVPVKPLAPPKENEEGNVEVIEPKEKKKEEKSQFEIRKENMRKKFSKGQVELSQMTMFDLIYHNPDGTKPVRSKEKLVTRRRTFEMDTVAKKDRINTDSLLQERLDEEDEMRRLEEEMGEKATTVENDEEEDEEEETVAVPQVRLGPDGQIIIDDQSLVIETTEAKKNKRELSNAPIIIENGAGLVNYGSWSKRKRSSKWTLRETARFYRALSMLGTDFSLMENLFPNRCRFELKRKFKLEEKNNQQLIDKIIATQKPFDPAVFGNETDDDISDAESALSEKSKKTKKAPATSRKRKKDANSVEEKEADGSEVVQDTQETETPVTQFKKKRRKKNAVPLEDVEDEAPPVDPESTQVLKLNHKAKKDRSQEPKPRRNKGKITETTVDDANLLPHPEGQIEQVEINGKEAGAEVPEEARQRKSPFMRIKPNTRNSRKRDQIEDQVLPAASREPMDIHQSDHLHENPPSLHSVEPDGMNP